MHRYAAYHGPEMDIHHIFPQQPKLFRMSIDLANNMVNVSYPGRRGPPMTLRGPFGFECAWGFKGRFDQPTPLPPLRAAFLPAIAEEIESIDMIRAGFQAYRQAINSNKSQGFSTRFLASENMSTGVSLDQLDQIKSYLEIVEEEIRGRSCADSSIHDQIAHDVRYCRTWVARCRAILVHSHVYYKVNYTLVGAENKDQTMVSKS